MHPHHPTARTHRTSSTRRLIAAAALTLCGASGVMAQSNVLLYGMVDLSVSSIKAPGGAEVKTLENGQMSTSYFGFKGVEDLGGGLSAQFALEGFMRNDTGATGRFNGDAYFARSSWVGLANAYGALALGRNTTSLFVNTLVFNAFGDSFGFSPSIRHYFISGTATGDTGWNDSIKFNSANYGGLSFTGHVAAAEGSGGKNAGLSAMFFTGNLGLGGAWQEVKKGAAVDDTTTWQVSGSYDFKPVKVYAHYGKVDYDTTRKNYSISGLGGDLTLGQGKVLLQWGKISPDVGADRTTVSVGYDYFLSKRTDIYAAYRSDKVSGLSSGTSYSGGIRHRF